MRRWILLITLSLVFLGLTLVGFGSWLLRSTAGTTWLIGAVADVADVQITTGQLEGRLADELMIEELRVAWPDGQLTIKRLHLDWDPFSVLHKKLNIRVLEVDQLVILKTGRDGSPEAGAVNKSETFFAANDLALLPSWLTVEIDRLQILGIAYQDDLGAAVIADEISGRYLWTQWQINASKFSYLSPYVQLRGAFDWNLQRPHLEMTANVILPDTLVEPSMLKDIAVPADFPVQISFDGDWNSFSGPVTFGVDSEMKDTVWLAAEAHGSWQGVRFNNLQGRYLNGSLAGDLDLAWIDSYRMHGALTGAGLDLGLLVEDLDGRAHLDVSGELLIPYDERPLQASLDGLIHEGQLRGHTLAGKLAADWQGGGLNELNLDLHSEDARVIARGKPSERLDLNLDIADLHKFHPDLSGQMQTTGWLRWTDDYLTGEIDGSGVDLVWKEYSLASLNFQGRHLARQEPFEGKLDGKELRSAEMAFKRLQLGLNGSLESHDIHVVMDGLKADLSAQLAGRYRDEVWQAELKSFSGQTIVLGDWALEEPASIKWQEAGLSVDHFSLASSQGERVTLVVPRWTTSTTGDVALTWQDLRHDWLTYFQSSQPISGRSSGKLNLEVNEQQIVSLEARLTASAELQDDLAQVVIPTLTAEVSWLQEGLTLDINAESDTGELLVASARSSQQFSKQWPPNDLSLDMRWQGVSLERLNRFREGLDVQGQSDGNAQLEILDGKLLGVNANFLAEGLMQQKAQPVGLHSLSASLKWDDKDFNFTAQAKGLHDGSLALQLTSTEDPGFSWPDSGQIEMQINDLNLQSFYPVLPSEASFDGIIRGKSSGYWQKGGQIFIDGQVGLDESELMWKGDEGKVGISVQSANLEWKWQGEHLTGSLALLLAEKGELRGTWQLPLPARWPVDFVEGGALQANLQGQLRASGLLATIAPGLVQDLQGLVMSDIQVEGSWNNPIFSGRLSLTDMSAYLPSAGITIENIKLHATLQGDQLNIEEFSLNSGPGVLGGSGTLKFDRWQLERYHLEVDGENLQVYNFPELQVLCNPELTLNGDLETIQLRGNVLIPKMDLLGTASAPEFQPSNDVVISMPDKDDRKVILTDADIRVVVELGEQVWVKTAGVQTRLTGGATVTLDKAGQLGTWGEINLVEGFYKAYGATLNIKQGLLSYSGGPITNPDLRIFAARDVGTVQAGVQITGNAEVPVVSLYSRPSMPERDIMAYIFMGRPMRIGQEGSDAMMIGAGALMPYGDTFSDLGISEVDIQGLFDGTGGVRLRNRLTERLELESTLGVESGVDLYYIFEFD